MCAWILRPSLAPPRSSFHPPPAVSLRATPCAMAVTAEDVIRAYDKAKDAAEDADGNDASEERCVDCLRALARMEIPLATFVQGALGDVPKGIKKWAKKGPTAKIREAADLCVTAWKKRMTAGAGAADPSDAAATAADPDKKTTTTKVEDEGAPSAEAPAAAADGDGDGDGDGDDPSIPLSLPALLGASLGDPLRDRTRLLLAEAIALCVGEKDVYASLGDAAQTASAIEKAMFARWTDAGKEYKAKCRQLSFNLRDPKNPDLRRSVADGFIAADRLLDLSPEDLASEEKRRDNAKIREHATNEAVRGQRKEASTDAFKCGKCKQRKCTYYQLQTRSADEPMTTFVTCVNCDNRWKFC